MSRPENRGLSSLRSVLFQLIRSIRSPRRARLARSCERRLGLSPHARRRLVRAQSEKRRMPEMAVGGPLDESNLCDEARTHPLHVAHFFDRHSRAPM